jgi:hypothetical protein
MAREVSMTLKMLFGDSNDARSKVGAPSSSSELAAIFVLLLVVGILTLL